MARFHVLPKNSVDKFWKFRSCRRWPLFDTNFHFYKNTDTLKKTVKLVQFLAETKIFSSPGADFMHLDVSYLEHCQIDRSTNTSSLSTLGFLAVAHTSSCPFSSQSVFVQCAAKIPAIILHLQSLRLFDPQTPFKYCRSGWSR